MPAFPPAFPDPCENGTIYDLIGTCVSGEPVYSWAVRGGAFTGDASAKSVKPCGGVSDPVAEAVKAGWPLADVVKLVKELKK